jgi:hypothetical protein
MMPAVSARAIWAPVLFAACAPLDRTPPFRSPTYAHELEAIEDARVSRGHDGYLASWAKTQIRAPAGVPLAGYGARRGAPSRGVRDPALVRAFAVRSGKSTVLLFTADLLLLDRFTAEAIRRGLEGIVPRESIFFTASHTHSGPGGYAKGLVWELVFGAYDARAFEAVVQAHVDAGRRAIATLAPAEIGSAHVDVPGLIKNRTERGGPTDDALLVIAFAHADGGRALFWSFGCHAVTLDADNMDLSADYPGAIARALEASGFDVVGFAAGGVGSSNPRFGGPRAEQLIEPLRRALERGASAALARAKGEGRLSGARAEVELPPFRYRIAREAMVASPLAEAVIGSRRAGIGALAMGDTLLLSMPAELSGELTREIRLDARRRGLELAVLPFNGDYVGYVVGRRVYDLDESKGDELFTYETRTMSFLGPYAADLLLNLGLRLGERVRDEAQTPALRSRNLR